MRNNKLSIAIHILIAINKFSEIAYPITSDFLASSCNTNPAVIRRIISQLKKSGLVASKRGYVVNDFEQLTMYDVKMAVDPDTRLLYSHKDCNEKCPIGSGIEETMTGVYNDLQASLNCELQQIKLIDIQKKIILHK